MLLLSVSLPSPNLSRLSPLSGLAVPVVEASGGDGKKDRRSSWRLLLLSLLSQPLPQPGFGDVLPPMGGES